MKLREVKGSPNSTQLARKQAKIWIQASDAKTCYTIPYCQIHVILRVAQLFPMYSGTLR